ncbi:7 transmembrane receptor [Opisthorchis viverrini]|uniref:7 transmembrane receptor n=1 Tax=Opisthorchis viverrini TaxID=6198 RepID=A0A1S8X6K7_OPIVI|nr:7 transmembrane receptor [Opisthorchis viverrini]
MNTTVFNDSSLTLSTDYSWIYLRRVLIGTVLTSTVVLTILGNSLVVLAVLRESHMRSNLTNRFLVSLAVADLFMGSVVMPFAVFHTLSSGAWVFGRVWCDLWHAFDVLSSTASILNLCAIAVERFWATESPISHASRQTRQKCTAMMVIVWICSILISFPAIAWWKQTSDYIWDDSPTCRFTTDRIYLIVSSMVSFYIPFVVMISVYTKIYRTATNLVRSLRAGEKVVSYSTGKNNQSQTGTCFERKRGFSNPLTDRVGSQGKMIVLRMHRGGIREQNLTMCVPQLTVYDGVSCTQVSSRHSMEFEWMNTNAGVREKSCNICSRVFCLQNSGRHTQTMVAQRSTCPLTQHVESGMCSCIQEIMSNRIKSNTVCPCLQNEGGSNLNYHNFVPGIKKKSKPTVARLVMNDTGNALINQPKAKQWMSKLRHFAASSRLSKFVREQKAAQTLGLVMGLFVICWLPFFICNLIVAFFPDWTHSNETFQIVLVIVTWLGYINSSINPIIYAHSIREFRRAFKRLLCPWRLKWTRCQRHKPFQTKRCNDVFLKSRRNVQIHVMDGASIIQGCDAEWRADSPIALSQEFNVPSVCHFHDNQNVLPSRKSRPFLSVCDISPNRKSTNLHSTVSGPPGLSRSDKRPDGGCASVRTQVTHKVPLFYSGYSWSHLRSCHGNDLGELRPKHNSAGTT